jgi:parallel beta-helix repeat protein
MNALTYRPFLEPFEDRLLPSTYAVINTADTGQGSLRQALLDANANSGPNTIIFDIRGEGGHTIQPGSPLPTITRAVTIDGTYQPGYNGSPLIEIDGEFAGTGVNGLTIDTPSGATIVKGLDINRFRGGGFSGGGIRVQNGTTSTSVAIQGDYLGTDITGTAGLGNSIGVEVFGYNGAITIGGPTADAVNVISGNEQYGVQLWQARTSVIQNNLIGTDVTGTQALGNGIGLYNGFGVYVTYSSPQILDNIISGNSQYGIVIGDATATIQRNWIGIDVTGTQALPNGRGIEISADGVATVRSNVISGNLGDGVAINGDENTVQGNYIGTDITGAHPLANGGNGITLSTYYYPSGHNTIGGTVANAGNVISGNSGAGISITTSSGNRVQGNLIGTDITGTQPIGNGGNGIIIVASNFAHSGDNTIGGTAANAGNVIAFNGHDGIMVNGSYQNSIRANSIFANGNLGIELVNAGNNNQPAPVITSAVYDGSAITIQGTVTGAPNTTVTMDLFASDAAGDGQHYLGSVSVVIGADGTASFGVTFSAFLSPGQFITATSTGSLATSGFSNDIQI